MLPSSSGTSQDPPADDELGCGAAAIAARVRRLVAQHERGDVCAAARRLGVPVRDLIRLERLLAEDAAESAAAAERVLVAVVMGYPASATWLLTGSEHPAPRRLPPTVRLWLAQLLLAVGTRIVDDYHVHAPAEREPPRPSA